MEYTCKLDNTGKISRRHFFAAASLMASGVSLLTRPSVRADEVPSDADLARRISEEAIARRKQMVVRAIAADPSFSLTKQNPKYQHALVGTRLALNPKDADALEYVRRVAAFDDMFAYQGLAALYARFGDSWSKPLVDAVRESALHWNGFLGGGTENMVAMRRMAGVVFGERFPDEKFLHDLTGRQLVEECKQFMRRYGRAVFGGSMVEYLSPIYLATNSAAWLNAAEFARDDETRLMAEAVLDWMFADLAVNSFECSSIPPIPREKGLLTGTYQRSFPDTNTQWVSWMFFGGGNLKDDGGALPAGRDPFKAPVGFHALSKWSPHPIVRAPAGLTSSRRWSMPMARRPRRARSCRA